MAGLRIRNLSVGNVISMKNVIAMVAIVVSLAGCNQPDAGQNAPQPAMAETLTTAIRVRVAPVVETRLGAANEVTGVVSAFRKATVAAEVPGRVVRRGVEPGDVAKAGDVLVELDFERAELDVRQAEAHKEARLVDLAHAEHEHRRAIGLHRKDVISQDVVDDLGFDRDRAKAELAAAGASLASARRALRDTRVVAPFDGTAEVVHVQEGDYLNPGAPVATLTDFSKARIRAGVTAAEASAIRESEPVSLVFEALGGAALAGTIRTVSRIKETTTGTYPVEIWLPGEEASRLREGMVATVHFSAGSSELAVAIPKAALFRREGGLSVYAIVDGRASARAVRIGRSSGDLVEVREGLSTADTVVVDGQFALRDGMPVVMEPAASRAVAATDADKNTRTEQAD
jgi:RND family efflux transporter MFP subunit